jgi:dihydropteroate synthase
MLSLDTWRSEVARAAAHARVDLVNDTWAGYDSDLLAAAVEIGAGYVVSHTGGYDPRAPTPSTSPTGPTNSTSSRDVVGDSRGRAPSEQSLPVCRPSEFSSTPPWTSARRRHTRCGCCGIRPTWRLGLPGLAGACRAKDFVGETLDLPADERLEGSLAATAVAAWLGATVFRAHDVRATRRVVDMVASIRGDRAPHGVDSRDSVPQQPFRSRRRGDRSGPQPA